MSEQSLQPPEQNLNISDSVLESVQIAGNAGRDMKLTQIQGRVETINVFGLVKVDTAPTSAAKTINQQEYRWRRVLLDKVKKFWINGVLEKSLHTQVLIDLGLEERSEFVQNRLSEVEEFPSDSVQVFPAGITTADIFEGIGAGRTLLILGEPGSGKTVTLLKLAESLIARTENDLSQPLPVVVNLSSWAKQRKPITDWLVQEIYEIYGASKSLGKIWVEQEQLILLLDGLDEVNTKYRNDCVKALNQFIQTHGLTEIVVCSRIRDYENLSERLKLRSAIYVQSLTSQQIDQFLERAGESLLSLKTVLHHNSDLRAFASSPLILSIMVLAYQDCSVETLTQVETPEAQHQQLFDTYIDRMFMRRGTTRHYPRLQTQRWLTWLARGMMQASQTIFLIERLQPSCLPSQFQMVLYRMVNVMFIGLILGMIYGIYGSFYYAISEPLDSDLGLIKEIIYGLILGLYWGIIGIITGLIVGLIVGVIDGLIFGLVLKTPGTIGTIETLKWSWREAIKGFKNGWIGGLTYTIVFTPIIYIGIILTNSLESYIPSQSLKEIMPNGIDLISNLRSGITLGSLWGMFLGMTLGTFLLVIIEKHIPQIKNVHWFEKTIKFQLIPWLLFGLIGGIVWSFGHEFISKFIVVTNLFLTVTLFYGLFFGIFFGLISALIGGFQNSEIQKSAIPNQGIRKSIKNSLIFGVTFGLLIGLIVGLNNVESLGIFGGILLGIWFFGPIGALISGGSACFRHFTLRLMLYRKNYIPWNYSRFLDYTTERLFMQKVGGGYIFVHRMLLEHFAQMELERKRS